MRSVCVAVMLLLVMLQTVRLSVGAPIDAPIETTAETTIDTTVVPTTTFCAPPSCGDNCFLDTYSGGCPTQCICGDPICMLVSCGPDEDCVPNNDDPSGYTCVPKYGTTTTLEPTIEFITGSSAPPCEDMSWCYNTRSCYLDDSYGYSRCPECICADYWEYACKYASCGPDEHCVPNEDSSWNYTCVPYVTTTSPATTTTTTCPPYPLYHRAPGCAAFYDSDGCITARCFTCDDIPPCGEGTTCELQICDTFPCPPPAICVPTIETCPPSEPCYVRCRYGFKTDENGCQLCECLDDQWN